MKKCNSTIWKINMSQLKKVLNILGAYIISKKWKIKFENKTIE